MTCHGKIQLKQTLIIHQRRPGVKPGWELFQSIRLMNINGGGGGLNPALALVYIDAKSRAYWDSGGGRWRRRAISCLRLRMNATLLTGPDRA